MPKTNRPADTRCFVDDDYTSCRIDASGVCLWCDLATCDACGAPVLAADAHRVHWVPADRAPGLLCVDCLENGEGDDAGFLLEHMGLDAGGVPVAVDEAATVRAAYEPIGAEGLGEVRAKMPLKTEAVALLASLPRRVRTCQPEYAIALALSREELVRLDQRTVLGNGQVRYLVEAL